MAPKNLGGVYIRLRAPLDVFKQFLKTILIFPGTGGGLLHEATAHMLQDKIWSSELYYGSVSTMVVCKPGFFSEFEAHQEEEVVFSALLFNELTRERFADDETVEIRTRDNSLIIEGSREEYRVPLSRSAFSEGTLEYEFEEGALPIGYMPVGVPLTARVMVRPRELMVKGEYMEIIVQPPDVIIKTAQIGEYKKQLTIANLPQEFLSPCEYRFDYKSLSAILGMFDGMAWLTLNSQGLVLSSSEDKIDKTYVLARNLV